MQQPRTPRAEPIFPERETTKAGRNQPPSRNDPAASLDSRFRQRFERSYDRIRDAYLHKEVCEPPLIIGDIGYWLSGDARELIPEDYFNNVQTMFAYQMGKIEAHLQRCEDDYIPLLFPWYGTGVVPSALGCEIAFPAKMDPAVGRPILEKPRDVRRLSLPNPYSDGLMPRVLECIDYMRANSDLPVSFTDPQGPLNIALCLCGAENLFVWMYEYPNDVHEIMEFCTEALIEWITTQKRHAGQELDGGGFPHGIVLPKGFGGVWICDDDCTVISARLYEEFVVPYNARVLKAFGGGTLHFCGTAEHQLENFLKIEGLTGINNFCMGNFRQIMRMQDLYKDRLALMVCDFTPLNIEEYYRELLRHLKAPGTILATYIAPEFALSKGKYHNIYRDGTQLAKEAEEAIKRLIREGNVRSAEDGGEKSRT